MRTKLSVREIVGASFDARSQVELRAYLLHRIVAAVGADAGYFVSFEQPVASENVIGVPPEKVESLRLDSERLIPPAIFAPVLEAVARHGAAVDVDVLGERRRQQMPIYSEYLVPFGISAALVGSLLRPGSNRLHGAFSLLRVGPRQFSTSAVRDLGAVAGVIALADAAFDGRHDDPTIRLTNLTDRQREICGHVATGLTNAEIAKACGISLHTVRNHLVALFRRFDVLTRTELAMRVTGCGVAR